MKNSNTPPNGKKKYTKPRLRTIELATDEVLAGSCKTSGATPTGPGTTPCFVGVPISPCATLGS